MFLGKKESINHSKAFHILEIQKIQEKKYDRFYVVDVDLDKSTPENIFLVFTPYDFTPDWSFIETVSKKLDFRRYVGNLSNVVNLSRAIQFECIPLFNNRDIGLQLSRQIIDKLEKKLFKT